MAVKGSAHEPQWRAGWRFSSTVAAPPIDVVECSFLSGYLKIQMACECQADVGYPHCGFPLRGILPFDGSVTRIGYKGSMPAVADWALSPGFVVRFSWIVRCGFWPYPRLSICANSGEEAGPVS